MGDTETSGGFASCKDKDRLASALAPTSLVLFGAKSVGVCLVGP